MHSYHQRLLCILHVALATTLSFAQTSPAPNAPPPQKATETTSHPLSETERQELITAAQARFNQASTVLQSQPNSTRALSARGDAALFLGKAKEAVADFEKSIQLDPSLDEPHWRLGIAYYFAGQYEKSAAQFAKYHAYDARDRENGVWKFMAQVKAGKTTPEAITRARAEMLPYTQFDREPFPTIYEMLEGKKTVAQLIAHASDKGDGAVFFANYYGGIMEEINGNRKEADILLGKAVGSPWGKTSEGGPAYMWQCARLHWEALKAAAKK